MKGILGKKSSPACTTGQQGAFEHGPMLLVAAEACAHSSRSMKIRCGHSCEGMQEVVACLQDSAISSRHTWLVASADGKAAGVGSRP
jgi:hypothetical protein